MLTLAAWVHDLDPYAIQLWEGGPIRWYGLAYLVAFGIGYLLLRRVATVGLSPLPPARVGDFVVTVAIGIVLGGRLGYAIFYDESGEMLGFSSTFPYWGMLALWHGGMASHGGIVGGIVACLLFGWRHKISKLFLLDLFAFGAPLGLLVGRIANFINGELYGRPCDPDFPLAVKFPTELLTQPDLAREVMQRLAAMTNPESAAGLHILPRDVYELIDFIQRGFPGYAQAVAPLLTPRHPSQLYAAATEGLLTFLVLLWIWHKPRLAGTVGAAFCMCYAVMRIGNEFFRMPDAQLLDDEFAAIGLSRGQLLSVPIFLLGLLGYFFIVRRYNNRVGGWRHLADPD